MAVVLTPVNFLFTQWKKLLRVLLRHQDDDGITEEELMGMVDQAETEGSLDQHESDLIRNAIEFNDMEVSEILTPPGGPGGPGGHRYHGGGGGHVRRQRVLPAADLSRQY